MPTAAAEEITAVTAIEGVPFLDWTEFTQPEPEVLSEEDLHAGVDTTAVAFAFYQTPAGPEVHRPNEGDVSTWVSWGVKVDGGGPTGHGPVEPWNPFVRQLAAGLALAGGLLPSGQPGAGTPTGEVAAVQGNVPHSRTLAKQLAETIVTGNHAAASEQLAAQVKAGSRPAPDVVIWPESSAENDPSLDPAEYATIGEAVAAINRPVLVGEVLQNPLRNAGQLWLPGRGPVAIYVKRQLVPFGEYIPFRGLISSFSSLPSLQPHNFTAGRRAVVFHIGKVRLGDVICYEVGFDNLVSSEVSAGANLLTEQTNDADFELDGQLGETLQQLAMARIRAVEFDRAMVVAGTTGVSAIIAPDGALITSSRTWQRTVLEARVPLLSDATLALRLGEWPEIVLSALAVAALAWAIALGIADRRRAAR